MTEKETERAWIAAEKAAQAERTRLLTRTRAELLALLKKASDDITLTLAGAPTDYQQWHMSQLQKEIDRVTGELAAEGGKVVNEATTAAWEGGKAAIETPLAASGLKSQIGPLPKLDTAQLMAMRAFMVDRIEDISRKAASAIKQELGLAMIGSQGIHETIKAVAKHLDEVSTVRATTIVRSELGRVWAVASYERAAQATLAGVPMDKIWRRSGKVHSRLAHDLADGQRVPVEQPFLVAGIKMRYPHDPRAPAKETINCGCVALYRPREWKATLPDKRPFTQQEINANPYKADIDKLRQATPATIAEIERFLSGTGKAPLMVATAPKDIVKMVGASTEEVLLSRYTADKQQKHPEITASSFGFLQDLLDNGERLYDKKHHATIIQHREQPYVAVLKATADGEEIYLQSFRRTDAKNIASLKKRGAGGG